MARTQAKQRIMDASSWLPGFEPEDFLSTNTAQIIQMFPPMTPTPVALVTAAVVHASLSTLVNSPSQQHQVMSGIYADAIESFDPPFDHTATEGVIDEELAEITQKSWCEFSPVRYDNGGTLGKRIEKNLAAVELMLKLRSDPASITDDDRHTLLSYSGWGGAARMFEELPGNTLAPHRDRLQKMISTEEFTSARASTTNAYYTDSQVISAMWQIVRRLGFNGGRVAEPAAGTGLFLAGMPPDLALKSEITAVELDKLSSELLGQVFGGLDVTVHSSAIEKAPVPDGFYDLVISNVPFGDHKSLETRKVGYAEWSIHNYFIGKSIDMVRAGGLVVVITSSFTMDSNSSAHRDWISAHAELLGAIRLPNSAFKKSAGTEVVTDILVFKKRTAAKFNAVNTWGALAQADESMMRAGQSLQVFNQGRTTDRERKVNQWFTANPHMVIGDLVLGSGRYGADMLTNVFSGDEAAFERRLNEVVLCMPEAVYMEPNKDEAHIASLQLQTVKATSKVKPGAFVMNNGRICVSESDSSWIDVDDALKGKARERVIGLIGIKEAARRLIETQMLSNDDAEFKIQQLQLNIRYDAFISSHGNVTDTANVRVFRSDPDCPLVLSLEQYDEASESYKKADIFSKRTAGKKSPPEQVDNIKDAIMVSLGLYGRLHLGDMAKRMRVRGKDVTQGLRDDGLAYIDPVDSVWKIADEYLAGNIMQKIYVAKAAGTKFAENVNALTSVLPDDLGPGEVEVRLGAPWVPVQIVKDFTNEIVGTKPNALSDLDVTYAANTATWSITLKYGGKNREYFGDTTRNTQTWGTSRRCAIDLIESALNQVPPKITKTVDDKTVLDKPATMAAREKYEAIRDEFKAWAYRDDARRDQLLRIYNDEFNQIVERKYDGSHLVLYGMSPVITPYQHQLDAIWRIVSGGNTLLAHVVGAGKTFTMIAAAMEMRRIGKANKPLIVVPNHLLEQFTSDCVRFYPSAKVLMASKLDMQGDKRNEFVARIATGDWDAVVMTHSTFERLPTSPGQTKAFMDELMEQARNSLAMAREKGARASVRQCEKLIKTLEAKVERALNESAKDDLVYFDELGVDYLFFDEAHVLKNLMRISKMPSIAGLSASASNRSFDAWVKTSLIMQARGDKEEGVTFATATPIANSVAECHVMQKFLQPYSLKKLGLYEFDAWAATFGESVQAMEISPDGGGYRLNTRFARFVNVPDLMSVFRMVADIKTRSMVSLPTPEIKGGRALVIVSPPTDALLDYTAELVERAAAIRSGSVKPDEDNMLTVTNCGRRAALDMRLIDPSMPFDPQGKIAKAVENIMRIWHETMDKRGTQLVFCDLSTPKNTGFSVYNDLRQRLIDAGMPAAEIAFIHDFDGDTAKAKLFREVRSGRIRLLMGSTQKLGMGTNVQKRLKAVHQIDAPWRPADVEQRDGRVLRAGNIWPVIELVRYVTEQSFDAYIWSLLETKARFIEQVMTAGSTMRSIEDMSMGALSYAEIKAISSGNPLVLEKATVDAQVMKYSMIRDTWEQDRWSFGRKIKGNADVIKMLEVTLASVELDADMISKEGAALTFKANGPRAEADSSSVEARIGAQIHAASRSPVSFIERVIGEVGGMHVIFSRYDGINVSIRSPNDERINYGIRRDGVAIHDQFGTGKLVVDMVASLVDQPAIRRERITRMRLEIEQLTQSLEKPYEHAAKLSTFVLRQREIEAMLDTAKDEAGTMEASEAPQS